MRVRVRTLADQPSLVRAMRRFHDGGWPEFLRDDAVNALWSKLYTTFPDYQLALLDHRGRVVAIGNTIPIAWNGRAAGLPDRIADVLRGAIALRRAGTPANALSALAAIVDRRYQGRGLSAAVIEAMRDVARARGFASLVAPVRPSFKGRYPLTPMAEYVRWRHPEGGPLDPWLRVHWRLGARVVRITPRGNTVRRPVDWWEAQTGLRFPSSGRYVVPGAFQPIRVDRARNRVRYDEANVWMRHRVDRRG
jgi:GNAT superfamily N-acetyltransferase